ncbi:MAG: hypothetical protein LBU44_06685 [Mediterranea sp.]|jgi:hypothetical protein|nr:hypothetical protein [Mediterranea sp.]
MDGLHGSLGIGAAGIRTVRIRPSMIEGAGGKCHSQRITANRVNTRSITGEKQLLPAA